MTTYLAFPIWKLSWWICYLWVCACGSGKHEGAPSVHITTSTLAVCVFVSVEYFTARDNNFNPIFATYIFIVMLDLFRFFSPLGSFSFSSHRSHFETNIAFRSRLNFFYFFFFNKKTCHKNGGTADVSASTQKIKNTTVFIRWHDCRHFARKMTNSKIMWKRNSGEHNQRMRSGFGYSCAFSSLVQSQR